jgi:TatD DNase family protein
MREKGVGRFGHTFSAKGCWERIVMFIIDTHAHYEDEAFDEDREELLHSMKEQGIGLIVNIGSSMETTRKTLALTKKYDFIYGAAGVHPSDTAELEEESLYGELKEMALNPKIAAVGEIGLDYYWDEPERNIQKKHFERQLELAREIQKPVVIHSREAAADTLDIMKSLHAENIGGIIHCFSYGKEMAREYLNMGYYLGIGGVITFTNAKKLKEVVAYMPLDRLVLETDSPYLAPVPNRGKRNSSLNLPYVVEKIAEIKGISKEAVVAAAYENAAAVYRLKLPEETGADMAMQKG